MLITNAQIYMFDTSKQVQTIKKALVVAITNFFTPEQCKDSAGRASQITIPLIKNLVKPYSKISKKANRNLNLLP